MTLQANADGTLLAFPDGALMGECCCWCECRTLRVQVDWSATIPEECWDLLHADPSEKLCLWLPRDVEDGDNWDSDYCSGCSPHSDTWARIYMVGGLWKLEIGDTPAGRRVLFEGSNWTPEASACPSDLYEGTVAAACVIHGAPGTPCEDVELVARVDCLCCACPELGPCRSQEFNNQGTPESPATTGFLGGKGLPGGDGNAEFSVSVWVKFIPREGEPNNLQGIFARARGDIFYPSNFKWRLGSQKRWNPDIEEWEGPYFYFEVGGRTVWGGSPYLNTWFHVVGVRRVNPPPLNTTVLYLYVNLAEFINYTGEEVLVDSGVGHCAYLGEGFCGRMCMLGAWDRNLSEEEVSTLYNGGDGLWCFPAKTYQLQVWDPAGGGAWVNYTDGDLAACSDCDNASPATPVWEGIFHRRYALADSPECVYKHPYGSRKINGKILDTGHVEVRLPAAPGYAGCHWKLEIRCWKSPFQDSTSYDVWDGYKVDRDELLDTCVALCSDVARWSHGDECLKTSGYGMPDLAPDVEPIGEYCWQDGCDTTAILRLNQVTALCLPIADINGYWNLIEGDGLISIERPDSTGCTVSFWDCATPVWCWGTQGCVPTFASCPATG